MHLGTQFSNSRKNTICGIKHLLLLVAIVPTLANAGSFSVVPVRVYMDASQPVASLKVTNQAEYAVMIQSDTRSWAQVDGKAVLQETSDLIVSPPIFELAAGATQTVRLAVQSLEPSNKEKSFRLFLKEIPLDPTFTGVGVQINLRLSLPVFLSPIDAKSVLQWSLLPDCGDGAKLQAHNAGLRHQQVVKLNLLKSQDNSVVEQLQRSQYVLAGSTMDWPLLSDPNDWTAGLLAQIETSQGAVLSSAVDQGQTDCNLGP